MKTAACSAIGRWFPVVPWGWILGDDDDDDDDDPVTESGESGAD